MAQKQTALDRYKAERERALEGPAARLVVAQEVKRSNGARVNVKPVEVATASPEIKRQEPAKMNLTPAGMGMQRPPDTNRPEFQAPKQARPLANFSPEKIKQGIAVQQAMSKVSALDRYIAQRPPQAMERPAEKLVMGKTKGMSM